MNRFGAIVLTPQEPGVIAVPRGSGMRLTANVETAGIFRSLLLVCTDASSGRDVSNEVLVGALTIGAEPMLGKEGLSAVAFKSALGFPEGAPAFLLTPGMVIDVFVSRPNPGRDPIACSAVVFVTTLGVGLEEERRIARELVGAR